MSAGQGPVLDPDGGGAGAGGVGESRTPGPGFDQRIGDVDASIGDIELKPEFSDPSVDVTHEREVADHEIVTGHSVYHDQGSEFVVQALGRKPPNISVTAWLTEDQLEKADTMISDPIIPLVTARFVGTAVPREVDIPYSRVWHDKYGWIFETEFDLIGVQTSTGVLADMDDPTTTFN